MSDSDEWIILDAELTTNKQCLLSLSKNQRTAFTKPEISHVEIISTTDAVDMVGAVEMVEMADAVDMVGAVEMVEMADAVDMVGAVEMVEMVDAVDMVGAVEMVEMADAVDMVGAVEMVEMADAVDMVGAVEIVGVVNETFNPVFGKTINVEEGRRKWDMLWLCGCLQRRKNRVGIEL